MSWVILMEVIYSPSPLFHPYTLPFTPDPNSIWPLLPSCIHHTITLLDPLPCTKVYHTFSHLDSHSPSTCLVRALPLLLTLALIYLKWPYSNFSPLILPLLLSPWLTLTHTLDHTLTLCRLSLSLSYWFSRSLSPLPFTLSLDSHTHSSRRLTIITLSPLLSTSPSLLFSLCQLRDMAAALVALA